MIALRKSEKDIQLIKSEFEELKKQREISANFAAHISSEIGKFRITAADKSIGDAAGIMSTLFDRFALDSFDENDQAVIDRSIKMFSEKLNQKNGVSPNVSDITNIAQFFLNRSLGMMNNIDKLNKLFESKAMNANKGLNNLNKKMVEFDDQIYIMNDRLKMLDVDMAPVVLELKQKVHFLQSHHEKETAPTSPEDDYDPNRIFMTLRNNRGSLLDD